MRFGQWRIGLTLCDLEISLSDDSVGGVRAASPLLRHQYHGSIVKAMGSVYLLAIEAMAKSSTLSIAYAQLVQTH